MKKINFLPALKSNLLIPFFAIILFGIFAFSKSINADPTVSVAADKMNIFYIGIDNPITVAVEGIFSNTLTVTCEDGEVTPLGNGHYNVQVFKPGNKRVTVMADGVATQEVIYRVKRIPDPIARIGMDSGGKTSAEYLLKAGGIRAYLSNWPMEEQCSIEGFHFTYQSKGIDPVSVNVYGNKFNDNVLDLLKKTKSGDVVYFDNIKANCPGDPAGRKINSMVFKIR